MTRVLIVDDDQDIREVVRFILEDANYDVLEAGDGNTALQMLRANNQAPMVVLLDLLMPQPNGIDVLKAIVADPPLCRHVYLLLTADNTALRQQAESLLAQLSAQIITKPFDVVTLLDMVEHAAQSLP